MSNTPGDNNAGWIGVDLDGTLAHYDHWRGPGHIGDPIEPMMSRVRAWQVNGVRVKIFTARVSDPETSALVRAAITEWVASNELMPMEVTCAKDFAMVALWDDRCVQVIPNTGMRADGQPD